MAADTEVAICTTQLALCESEGGTVLPAGTTFSGTATNPTLKGTLSVKCASSTMSGKTLDTMSEHLRVEVTSLSFSGCETCTTVDTFPPYPGSVLVGAGDVYTLHMGGSAELLNCPFGAHCTFETSDVNAPIENGGADPVVAIAAKLTVNKAKSSSFGCGSEGTWTARYDLSTPANGWFSLALLGM